MEIGQYERKTNADIEKLYNGPNIQKCLFAKILEWAGDIWRDKQADGSNKRPEWPVNNKKNINFNIILTL